ncbi:MAG: hypothetical protein K2L48_04855 [Mycoplasmoidaceae bacterium]|nr:hypothetical protein [Mycoplasmoidaceae bacterium]
MFTRIKLLNSSVDVNQLHCNIQDIGYANGMYTLNVYATDDSYYYSGTVTVKFQLNLIKETTLLGLKFKYSEDLSTPTVNDNVITINSDGFYAITDNDEGITDRNITIPNNKNVNMSINGNVTLQPSNNNGITLGDNAYLNLSTNADLTATGASSSGSAVYAGIRVPYTSEFIITGSNNGNLNVTGGSGYVTGAGIGGNGSSGDTPGHSDRTTSSLSCGTVKILGSLNADIKGGDSLVSDKGGASAGIGGGGCASGYAGSCKLVQINTNGTFVCEGSGNSNNFCYSGPGPAIGGGGSGSYKGDPGGDIKMFVGGDLNSLIINSGNINCIQKSVKTIVGASSVIGGGAAVGSLTKGNYVINSAGGNLNSFTMTGGFLTIKGTNGNFATISDKLSAIIGGGGAGIVNLNSSQSTNSKVIAGSLESLEQTNGNILIYNNSSRTDSSINSFSIGNGGCQTQTGTTPITPGTTEKILINGGSVACINGFNDLSFSLTPSNSKGQTLYPC